MICVTFGGHLFSQRCANLSCLSLKKILKTHESSIRRCVFEQAWICESPLRLLWTVDESFDKLCGCRTARCMKLLGEGHPLRERADQQVGTSEGNTDFVLPLRKMKHSHSTKHKLYPPCTSTPLIIDLELIEVVAAVIIFSVGTSTLLLPEPLYLSFGETLSALLKGSTLRQGRVLLHHLSSSVVNRLFVKARKRKLISICYFWTVINGRMPPL